ncbi:hypothetical protein LIA77_06491 [Sarocladium implicatum]|nr:hypothetical protein LIA77_06491 [Sarocladium implicatum]
MDRAALERNHIFFSDQVNVTDLPPRVSALRTALLDFDCTIPDRLGLQSDDDFDDLPFYLKQPNISDKERLAIAGTVRRFKDVKEEAERLFQGRDREPEWQTFFASEFFRPLATELRVKDDDSRRTSRTKYYYDYFELAQGRPWTLFNKRTGFRSRDRVSLTEPKPDWTASFPVYDFAASTRVPTSSRWRWTNSPKDHLVENFTLQNLEKLCQVGLESTTGGRYRREKQGSLICSDLMCFPWLIVEHKRSNQGEEKCYCQAANAGSAAVMMLQGLARYAKSQRQDGHVPPVVTMTTVDKIVRVWIVHSCGASEGYRMDCVWKGDATSLTDLLRLEALLENLHTWAMRVLRPWISSYLDLWKMARSDDLQNDPPEEPDYSALQALTLFDAPEQRSPTPSNSTKVVEDQPLSELAFRAILQEEIKALLEHGLRMEKSQVSTLGPPSPALPAPELPVLDLAAQGSSTVSPSLPLNNLGGLESNQSLPKAGLPTKDRSLPTDTGILQPSQRSHKESLRLPYYNAHVLFTQGKIIPYKWQKPIRVKLPNVSSRQIDSNREINGILNKHFNRKRSPVMALPPNGSYSADWNSKVQGSVSGTKATFCLDGQPIAKQQPLDHAFAKPRSASATTKTIRSGENAALFKFGDKSHPVFHSFHLDHMDREQVKAELSENATIFRPKPEAVLMFVNREENNVDEE